MPNGKSSAPAASVPAIAPEPTIVAGHQYHSYSRSSYGAQRYGYIGKDESGQPEFVDYGRKGGR